MEETTNSGGNSGVTTFAEAFAADVSPASTPSSESTTPPAAEQPGTETQAPPQDDREPFIPRPRFDEVNAKKAELETALNEWKQYEWAKQVNQADLSEAIRIAQLAKSDPITYLQDFIKDLQAHPTYGAQLKSLAARALSQRSQSAEPQLEMIPVDLGDGRIVQLATAESQQKREAWLKQQWLSEAEQKFQPFTQTVEQLKQREAALEHAQQVESYVKTTHADALTWPGMDDKANQVAVAEELKRMQVNEDDPREVTLALNAAWRKVVAPKLSSKAEASVLDNLQRKAAAATTVNPASTASTSQRAVTKFSDLGPDAWR